MPLYIFPRRKFMNFEKNYKLGEKASIFGIAVNLLLFLVKFSAGIFGRSQAMIADAFHTASDILTSVVVLVGFKIARKPADSHHPFGHGKAESIAAKIVSLVLITVGLKIMWSSFTVMTSGNIPTPENIVMGVALLSIIVKEASYRYVIKKSQIINSVSLKVDACHHRSDAFSSIAVLVGVAGAKFLSPLLDPMAGIIVAGFIVKMGCEAFHAAYDELMDSAPAEEFKEAVLKAVEDVEGLISVKDLKIRKNGIEFFVDMIIGVDGNKSVEEGHLVTVRIKRNLIRALSSIKYVNVHVEPV